MFSPIVPLQFHCFSVQNVFHPKGNLIFVVILKDGFVQFFYKFFGTCSNFVVFTCGRETKCLLRYAGLR